MCVLNNQTIQYISQCPYISYRCDLVITCKCGVCGDYFILQNYVSYNVSLQDRMGAMSKGMAWHVHVWLTVAGGGVHKSRGTWTHTDNARGVATNKTTGASHNECYITTA